MNALPRPSPRPAFLERARRLNVNFYTLNLPKYLQAKLVLEKFGLVLRHFRSRIDPYTENYKLGKEQLLANAIDEIKAAVGRTSLFFVEDTSLRIDALSSAEEDFPGLAVKEWFAGTTFELVNAELPKDRTSRQATIKSDIALHVPGLEDPVTFHGETQGVIAATAPAFEENPYYPWLTPNSFNGWFIPDQSVRRLGEMSLEESWNYDFRVRALTALVSRLEEYAAVLNAPRDCYTTVPLISSSAIQPSLFRSRGQALIVVGGTCAGKTTFGLIAQREIQNLKVIEASDVLRSFMRRGDSQMSPFEFAKHILTEHGPDAVARKLLQMYRLNDVSDFSITGFRTIEELETIRSLRPELQVVLIESSGRTRYARHLARARGPAMSYKEFLANDAAQWEFGLLRVAEDFADIRITNEGSLDDYRGQVVSVLREERGSLAPGVSVDVGPRHQLYVHRLFRCLWILFESERAMTCEEIEELSDWHSDEGHGKRADSQERRYRGKRITHNNVNKVLKAVPALAQRVETGSDRIRYVITDAGRAYVRLMAFKAETKVGLPANARQVNVHS